ncbi:MAG: hypothetical protein ACTSRC_01040 [Candidatus Helarchaeota archaeon]
MGKLKAEEQLEKLLGKTVKFNRVEIQFNDKSIIIEYLTPKKAVEHAVAYLFRVIEYFHYMGSILNVGSDKYKHIDIKKYFAHPMLRSELFNIEKNLLLYGGTIKYGGRVFIEISPSPIYKGRLVITTKTAWKKNDFINTVESLTNSFKMKMSNKIIKQLSEIIDEKIELDKIIREKEREQFLKKRKEDLEEKIRLEREKLAELEEQERLKEQKIKEKKMREWRIRHRLFPIADLASIHWDKRWMEDFDRITNGISNVRIENLEDEEFLRDYCDKVIDFIVNLDVYTIKNDPDIKDLMIRRIHDSKKEAIMNLMEPEQVFEVDVESRLQELIKSLPKAPIGTAVKPKPVPIDKETEEKEREQKEIPLFD